MGSFIIICLDVLPTKNNIDNFAVMGTFKGVGFIGTTKKGEITIK